MELRRDLLPPTLDAAKLARLASLAATLDGARPGQCDQELAEFNRLAGTAIRIEDFQGIYKAEDHAGWVRRLLYRRAKLATEISRQEMIEIVSRAMSPDGDGDFFLELFLANCKHPSGSDLLYWPDLVAELPRDREPTVEEIADLAMKGPDSST